MRVMIVDDNLLIRKLLSSIITEAGHDVVGEAENGADAVRLYELLKPDAVTLDLVMPGEPGLGVLFQLRRTDPFATVLVCSAHLTRSRVQAAIDLGASGFITKPFDRTRVLAALTEAVANRTTPAALAAQLGLPAQRDDRREFDRVVARLPITLMPAGLSPIRAVTTDISGNGIALENAALQVGQQLRFALRHGDPPIIGIARVVRALPGDGAALTIEDMSVTDHQRLIEHVHDLQAAGPAQFRQRS